MRVLLTGAHGFVGRWLARELRAAGHEVVETPPSRSLDLLDEKATQAFVATARPDGIVHLAGISFGPDATRDPDLAMRVNRGATVNVMAAAARLGARVAILISGSSEVYGNPAPGDLPLRESSPIRARTAYARSKLAQEEAALDIGAREGLPTIVTRSFNHTGPGQRPDFVAPALATRIVAARRTDDRVIPVGNLDVRRDLGDVRDVVRAYRLLIELAAATPEPRNLVVNVCTGRSVAVREVVEILAGLAGISVTPRVDPNLVRPDDAGEIVGDRTLVESLTGWQPTIPIQTTLADLLADVERAQDR